MSARQELAGIMEEWLQLTQAEGAAIQKSHWPALKRLQARKAGLRNSFTVAFRKCVQEDASAGPGPSATQPLRLKAARIMALLNRNAAALSAMLVQARACQETLDQSKRNLLRIQSTYANSRTSRTWNTYS